MHLKGGIKSLVHEFYTSLQLTPGNQIQVLGHTVDLSPLAINTFFKLKVLGDDQYTAFAKYTYNVQEVMMELTGQQRKLKPPWVHIDKAWLLPKARLLNQLLSARLMPTTSQSLVTKRRVELLYAMSKGYSINVGRVINTEMKLITHPRKATQAVGFPSLITRLCEAAGLEIPGDPSEQISLMQPLNWLTFEKKKPSAGGASSSHPQEEQQEQEEEGEEEEGDDDSDASASSEDSHRAQYQEDMEGLFANQLQALEDLGEMKEQLKRLEDEHNRHVAAFHHHQEDFHLHQEAFHHHQDEISDFIRY